MADNDKKTTIAGTIAGVLVAFGQPIISLFSQAPAEALKTMKLRDFLLGIAIAFLGKLSAGTKKE